MQDDHVVGGRQSPAERVAVTLESMPPVRPVEPVLAQQFSSILAGAGRPPAYFLQKEGAQEESVGWDKLKQRGFLMAAQMLDADAVSRQDDGNQNMPGKQGALSPDETEGGDTAGVRRLPILRLGELLLAENGTADFVNELAEFIKEDRNFGNAWHLEILMSGEQLPQTRLFIDSDETRLHLRFSCTDLNAYQLLEKNLPLLQDSLSSVSMRPVQVEIGQDPGVEAGAKGAA